MNNIKDQARSEVRELLARSANFRSMDKQEQLAIYKDLLDATYNRLSEQNGVVVKAFADDKEPRKASDLIDDQRHLNQRIDQAGELAGSFMSSVDFPTFVKDLLGGVFDANLKVTIEQMKAYTEMLKAATASLTKFIKDIDNTAAFGNLVENNNGFSLGDDNGVATLMDADGNVVARGNEDIGDNEVKARIMDAKIAMAKEHRAILRETILMGVTRLVVERGTVKAGVVFDIKASEKIEKKDKASMSQESAESKTWQGGTGFIGSIFGGGGAGGSFAERKSQISISSANSVSSTDLAAKVTGNVEIIFKSDYFKLDNFASMYGNIGNEQAPATAAPQAPRPAPAAPVAPATPVPR